MVKRPTKGQWVDLEKCVICRRLPFVTPTNEDQTRIACGNEECTACDRAYPNAQEWNAAQQGKATQAIKGERTDRVQVTAPEPAKKKLTARQEAFCQAYTSTHKGNATQSAIHAGYSTKTAHSIGEENLKKPDIMERIQELEAPLLEKYGMTREEIAREYKAIATSNLLDFVKISPKTGLPYYDFTGITRDQMGALDSIEITEMPPVEIVVNGETMQREVIKVKTRTHDKLKALDVFAKRVGFTKEAPPIEVTLNNMDPEDVARRIAFALAQGAAKGKKGSGAD